MKPSQEEAVKKAWTILIEHLDHCILAFETEDDDPSDKEPTNVFDAIYHGGLAAGIGLSERAKNKWLQKKPEDRDNNF